jgi:hypothetical protein
VEITALFVAIASEIPSENVDEFLASRMTRYLKD